MNKTILSVAVASLVGGAAVTSAQAATLSFSNFNASTDVSTFYTTNTSAFTANREFRMVDPTGALGGGAPLQKDTIIGGEVWNFDNGTGLMSSVSGTATTGGTFNPPTSYTVGTGGGACPAGCAGLDQGANFFGSAFGFLAPTVGSLAGNAYGEMDFTLNSPTSFTLYAPVLEAQWGGTYFPLGSDGGAGITFTGMISGTDFVMYAEHTITASEDPGSAGFAGWTAQWLYHGTISDLPTSQVPVPAAAWLLGSGLIGLVGVARRRKSA